MLSVSEHVSGAASVISLTAQNPLRSSFSPQHTTDSMAQAQRNMSHNVNVYVVRKTRGGVAKKNSGGGAKRV